MGFAYLNPKHFGQPPKLQAGSYILQSLFSMERTYTAKTDRTSSIFSVREQTHMGFSNQLPANYPNSLNH